MMTRKKSARVSNTRSLLIQYEWDWVESVKVGRQVFNHAMLIGPIPRPRPEAVIAPALVSRIQKDHRWRV